MVRYKPIKRKSRRFNGKKYYEFGAYRNKKLALKIARGERKLGWNAKVKRSGLYYEVFRKQTPNSRKWSVEDANRRERRRR